MNCTTCNQLLSPQASEFIVCPNCATVNLAQAVASTVSPSNNTPGVLDSQAAVAYATTPTNVKPHHVKPAVIIAGTASGLILLLLSMGGFMLYQNHQALNLLHSAQYAISKGSYEAALKQLDSAQGKYTFKDVHQQIVDLKKQDSAWVIDNQALQAAQKLNSQGKYSQANAQLAKIGNDFPGYGKALALSKTIKKSTPLASALAATTATPQPAGAATGVAAKVVSPTAPKVVSPPAAVSTIGKRFTSTAATSSLMSATSVIQAQQAIQSFASQYNLTMQITSVTPSSNVSSYTSYTILTDADLGALKTYGALFIDEWAKYPTDWVTNSKLSSIVIVKNLAISGTRRAAAPDPFGKVMYYDASYSGDYAKEVLHHEFNHLITFDYFGTYSPADPTWLSYNPAGFTYGNGGASCYQPGNSCLSGQHVVPGFVSGYATSGVEEDKAELYAYLMTGVYYRQLVNWLPGDVSLANKVNNYKQFINSHSPEMSGNYFSDINP